MSKKRIISKKSIIVLAIIMISIVVTIGGLKFYKTGSKSISNEDIIEKDQIDSENEVNKGEVLENQENNSETIGTDSVEEKEDSNMNESKNTNEQKNTTNNNQVKNNAQNSNSNNTTNNSNNTPVEQPKDSVSNEQSEPTNDNVDLTKVVDTNSFFYSIHKGQKDTSTESGCLKAGEDIANKELEQVMEYNEQHQENQKSVDINYFRCYEVTSQANTVMYYYLNIFCNSGNCNRYKSLVDMSKY